MKIPRYVIIIFALLLIFQVVQVYQWWKLKRAVYEQQKTIITALNSRHDKEIAYRDSLLLVHAKESVSEAVKIDSLYQAVDVKDETIKNLKYSNYQLKKQKDAIIAQLDSLSSYTHLPDL